MNPNNQSENDTIINNPVVVPATTEKKVGPIVATLIIVLVLIITALYVFASRINQPAIPTDNEDIQAMDATTPGVERVSNESTDEASMQNDLDTSTSGLDQQNF